MQSIGLFFGTFNPIHNGHLMLANHLVEHHALDEVWLVVTPLNPFKQKQSLLANHHRLEMVYRATHNYPKLRPSDIEFNLSTPNYTIDTLVHLEEKYPSKSFSLLLGEDNLASFHKWKNYEVILSRYSLYVYPRKNAKAALTSVKQHPNIHFITAPEIELSASDIRQWVKAGKNVRPLLPPESWQYLDEMNFYRK